MILLLKMVPKLSAKELFGVPKCRKAVSAIRRKCRLDELCSGMSYCDPRHQFNVKESAIDIKYGVF